MEKFYAVKCKKVGKTSNYEITKVLVNFIIIMVGAIIVFATVYGATPQCQQCGKRNKIGANYCNECGTPISGLAMKPVKFQIYCMVVP